MTNLIKQELIKMYACGSETLDEKRKCDFFRSYKNDCFWKGGDRCWNNDALEELENRKPERITYDKNWKKETHENKERKKVREVSQRPDDVRGNLSDEALQNPKG